MKKNVIVKAGETRGSRTALSMYVIGKLYSYRIGLIYKLYSYQE